MINFSANCITLSGRVIELDYPILEAYQSTDRILILYDPDSYKIKTGQFNNLLCLNIIGEKLWVAELPTTQSGDCYYKIKSINPLIAYSINSFICEVDTVSGKILNKEFIK